MNSLKVLYLINLLRNETSGKEKILAQLYENALDDNPDFRELRALLEENEFYFETGKALHRNGQNLLNAAMEQPADVFNILRAIRQAHEKIRHEAQACKRLLDEPGAFVEPITVVEKKHIPNYLKMLETLAASCAYLIAVYDGTQNLKRLTWAERAGFTERVHAVNLVFLPALCQINQIPRAWLITRKELGGKNLLGGTCFSISYLPYNHIKVLTSGLRTERLTPHFFLNMRAAETGESDVPYCWGVGNVVSPGPNDGLRLLQGQTFTKPPMPTREYLLKAPTNPLRCIMDLAGQRPFCVSPEDLVALMNYWQMGYEIHRRRQNRLCMFCGKPLPSGRMACPSHFSIERVRR
ncbi:MAG: hypothetical protein FWF10_09635 [Clostridiales bacterium]|nr:hypothetical protein [Clostridiales bacterium]